MLNLDNIHFIGIGGIGMSSLARILMEMGKKVSGSDIKDSLITNKLREEGATIYIGQIPSNLKDAEAVVISTAIKDSNPEFSAAQKMGLPIFHRSDILNFLLKRYKKSIGITGTHGKTSTTAMLGLILKEGNLNPTVSIGGEILQFDSNALIGQSEYLVAEVDESDKSLEHLSADLAIVTNLEEDHLEHYKNMDEIISSVQTFIHNMPETSPVILCWDDKGTRELAGRLDRKIIKYSLLHNADFKGGDIKLLSNGSEFKVYHNENFLGKFFIPVPGLHNVSNALGAIACAVHLGVPVDRIAYALANYKGVKRRFQIVGEVNGTTVVDDYAHHPSEVKATLMAAALQKRPITAIFQPHRYTRTYALRKEFVKAFSAATRIIITDIYSAGEENIHNINALDMAEEIARNNPNKQVYYFSSFDEIISHIVENPYEGELIFTLGAGDITTLGSKLIAELKKVYNSNNQSSYMSSNPKILL